MFNYQLLVITELTTKVRKILAHMKLSKVVCLPKWKPLSRPWSKFKMMILTPNLWSFQVGMMFWTFLVQHWPKMIFNLQHYMLKENSRETYKNLRIATTWEYFFYQYPQVQTDVSLIGGKYLTIFIRIFTNLISIFSESDWG